MTGLVSLLALVEETDLTYEGIETGLMSCTFSNRALSEETDLTYEGIETQCQGRISNPNTLTKKPT